MRCDCAPPRMRRTCWLMKIAKFLTRHCPTERAGQFINIGGFPEWNGNVLFWALLCRSLRSRASRAPKIFVMVIAAPIRLTAAADSLRAGSEQSLALIYCSARSRGVSGHCAFRSDLLCNCHGEDAIVVRAGGGCGCAVGLADEGLAFLQQARAVEQARL